MTGREALDEVRGNSGGQLSIKGVIITLIALLTLVFVSMALMWGFERWLRPARTGQQPVDVNQSPVRPSKTPLDPFQPQQRQAYDAAQKELLSSYGWIDEKQKLAHIPIEKAMQEVVQEYSKKD